MFRFALRPSHRLSGRNIHNLSKGAIASPLPTNALATSDAVKRPRRGGQNLSERYVRLEGSLRQKAIQSAQIQDMPGPAQPPDAGELPRVKPTRATVEMFHGFVVPEEPIEPGPEGAPCP